MATTSTPSTPGSRLLPLPQVPKHPSTKVRFLGCITHDPTAPASQLTLTHPPHRTRVRIDIALVADSHAPGTLCDGEWVNVIGYTPAPSGEPAAVVVVRALLLWSAGNVRLGAYEDVVFGGGDG